MNAHHRMLLRWIQQLKVLPALAVFLSIIKQPLKWFPIVNRLQPPYDLLHAPAETIARRRHAREHGVRADRRQQFAHRIVAIGGTLRNVSSACHTSVANGGLFWSFLNLITT